MAKMIRNLLRRLPPRHPYVGILQVRQRCTEQLIRQNQLLLERIILESHLAELTKKNVEARRVSCTAEDPYSDMWRGAGGWGPFDGKPLHPPQEFFSGGCGAPVGTKFEQSWESHSYDKVGWYGQTVYAGDEFFGAEKSSPFAKSSPEVYLQTQWTYPSASLDAPSAFGPIGSQQGVCQSHSDVADVNWSEITTRIYQHEKLSSANYSFCSARSFLGEEANQHWPDPIDVPPLRTTMDDPRDRWFDPYATEGLEGEMLMQQQDAEMEAQYMVRVTGNRPVDNETECRRDSGYSDGEDGFEVLPIDDQIEDEDSSSRVKFIIGGDSSTDNSFAEDEGSLVDDSLVSSIAPQLLQGSVEIFSVVPSTVEEKGSLVLDSSFSGQPIKKKRTKVQKVLSFFHRTFASCARTAE